MYLDVEVGYILPRILNMEPENHPNVKRKIIFRNPFFGGCHQHASMMPVRQNGFARKEISGFVTAGSNPFTEKTEDSSSPPSGGNFWDA